MNAKTFLDTNVLVYAADSDSPAKQARAKELIEQLIRTGAGNVSMQVLQEYYATATRKLGLHVHDVRREVEMYTGFNVVVLQPADLLESIKLHERYQFSIWDALIVRAALIAGCENLYTEDLQHGQRIGNLTILNPF